MSISVFPQRFKDLLFAPALKFKIERSFLTRETTADRSIWLEGDRFSFGADMDEGELLKRSGKVWQFTAFDGKNT